ncbi:MAG: pyridoxal phosphate-dependent aminotransferase [Candidatus Odinarchaeia archaeon]
MSLDRWIADRMDVIPPSGTINMFEKALSYERAGHKVIHLEVGEPDFDTPEHVKEEAKRAIDSGFTHYTSSRGVLELREAISKDLKRRNVDYDPEKEILVTPGAKHAILCALLSTLNPGDNVLVLTPAWPTYFVMIRMAGATPVEVPTTGNYSLDEDALRKSISSKTKMIIINSPNNPTGGVLEEKEMRLIADIAIEHDLLVLSDEIYDCLTYDNFTQVSMASFKEMKERTILINGFSKAYAMTGWRLGYLAAPEKIVSCALRIQQNSTTCPASFVQKAGVAALNGPQDSLEKMRLEYDKRRRSLVKALNEIDGVECPMPRGAFYVFPDVSKFGKPSKELCELILEKGKVCTTPGAVFKKEGHLRISYANSIENLLEGVERIKRILESL